VERGREGRGGREGEKKREEKMEGVRNRKKHIPLLNPFISLPLSHLYLLLEFFHQSGGFLRRKRGAA